MNLPNVENAVVAEAKILMYLINDEHPTGKSKAAFFKLYGFVRENWEMLADALLAHAATHEVASTVETPEGMHYVIGGELETPDGRSPRVRSVWAIDTGSDTPRLITAYPLKAATDGEA